ncbi:MAG: DUF58 domain-containing protein [Deltaproteobacteria bacterium]|nr:DUF58 domain-containing protein [Deltaproteobacteria bacterium]
MREVLDPALMASISPFTLRTEKIARGVWAGIHRSPQKGNSIEFSEYRSYHPGDDLRHLDWRVVAKTDRLYIRQFEHETSIRCWIGLDCSGSMDFTSREMPGVPPGARLGGVWTKFEYARHLAGALAYLLIGQHDRVGLFGSGAEPAHWLQPRSGSSHLERIGRALAASRPSPKAPVFPAVIAQLSERPLAQGLTVLFTDALDGAMELLGPLEKLAARRQEIVLFHVLDPVERDFPFTGLLEMEGTEGEGARPADSQAARAAYLERIRKLETDIERGLRSLGGSMERVFTDRPLDEALVPFLSRRLLERRGRR